MLTHFSGNYIYFFIENKTLTLNRQLEEKLEQVHKKLSDEIVINAKLESNVQFSNDRVNNMKNSLESFRKVFFFFIKKT